MLSQLLCRLDKGGVQSIQVLAEKINVSQTMIEQMLESLHRMGYIEKVGDASQNCNNRCKGCSMSRCCEGVSKPVMWMITKKGQQAVVHKQ